MFSASGQRTDMRSLENRPDLVAGDCAATFVGSQYNGLEGALP